MGQIMYTFRGCESHDSCILLNISERLSNLVPPIVLAHMLDLQEYGVTKKWVIIPEISKEVENKNIERVNAFARQYVPRRNDTGGSNTGGGTSGRSWILPLCVYIFVCVEIKTKRETVAVGMLENL